MRCSDLKELLSAYANDELNQTQKEFIEEHLANCLDCQAMLVDYRVTRERLLNYGIPSMTTDIRDVTMSRIKAKMMRTGFVISRWLVTAAFTFLIILLLTSIPSISLWIAGYETVSAKSIIRNSPEVRTALDGNPVEVEITSEVINNSEKLLVGWARTDAELVVVSFDPDSKQVVDVVKIAEIPVLEEDEKQQSLIIAGSDAKVRELLARGAVISDVHLIHTYDLQNFTTGSEVTIDSVTVTFGNKSIVTLKKGLSEWSVTIDLDNGNVIGYGQNSWADRLIAISQTVYQFINPLLIAIGGLLLAGLLTRKKPVVSIAGIISIVWGILGLYGGIYAQFPDTGNQLLSLTVPVLGLALGIIDLAKRDKGRWADIIGIVIGTLALIMQLMNYADSFQIILSIFIIVPIILGVTTFLVYQGTARSRPWVRIVSISTAAALIGLSLAIIQPWTSSDTQNVLAKAYSATEAVRSYRSTTNPFIKFATSSSNGPENNIPEINAAWEFLLPDRIHLKIQRGNTTGEYIFIGNSVYSQKNETVTIIFPGGFYSAIPVPSKAKTLAELDSLLYSAQMPDAVFDGIDCYRYEGAYLQDSQTVKVEYWIGKKDYLIRQIKRTYADGSTGFTRYFDFNEPITIEAPVDSSGQPLPGWLVVSDDYSSYLDPSLFPQTTTTEEYNPNPITTTTGIHQ